MKRTKSRSKWTDFLITQLLWLGDRRLPTSLRMYRLPGKAPTSLPSVQAHTEHNKSALCISQHHLFSSHTPGGDCWMNKQTSSLESRWHGIQNTFSKGNDVMRGFGFPEPAHKAELIYHTTERLYILVGNKGEKKYSYHINHKINKQKTRTRNVCWGRSYPHCSAPLGRWRGAVSLLSDYASKLVTFFANSRISLWQLLRSARHALLSSLINRHSEVSGWSPWQPDQVFPLMLGAERKKE